MDSLSPQLSRLLADNQRHDAPGSTQEIVVSTTALQALVDYWRATFKDLPALIISDDATFKAAAQEIESRFAEASIPTRRLILEPRPDDEDLVAESGVVKSLETLLSQGGPAIPLAVGAGTINDIVKYASFQAQKPYLVVPTAASMNGYTSTIAALVVGGVKRTLPCHQPQAIFADLQVLAAAPPHLNLAGFADLLSKPVSQSDWLLSHHVRGVPYDPSSGAILDALFAALLDQAKEIGQAEERGLRTLMEAILVSGFSMAIAGSSAPASGGEHLVSHYWDMQQLDQGAPLLALHGTQVGIATRLSAHLFERLISLPALPDAPESSFAPDRLDRLMRHHHALSPEVQREIRLELEKKLKTGDALREELTSLQQRWPEIRASLRTSLMAAQRLEDALCAAGCPTRPSEIGCDRDRAIHALRYSRHMRARYVAFDLLDDLGLLDGWAESLIDDVENTPCP